MKVFVISLRDAHARRAVARAQLEAIGLDFEFFDAHTGDAGYAPFFEVYDERRYRIITGRAAGPGEIGCYASHLALWKRCIDLDEPVLIFEDDFELRPNFPEAFAITRELIRRFGFIRLQHEDLSRRREVLCRDEFVLYRYTKMEQCLTAYAVNPAAARRLVEHSRVLTAPVDRFVTRFWLHKQPLFGLAPYPVYIHDLAYESTLLHEREDVERDRQFRAARFFGKIAAEFSRLTFNLGQRRLPAAENSDVRGDAPGRRPQR